jgi:hypothetical protein
MTGLKALLPDNKSPDLYPGGFDVLFINAVIADKGVGGNQYLSGKGGVGQHFLVSDHTGAEYYLAKGFNFSAKAIALINCTVFQY